MSDSYEECNPFPFTSQQVLPQSSTPKEGLENKESAEPKHVALQRIISLTDTESEDTYESFNEYSSLEEDKYLLEKKYAYDQVSMTEQMCKWRNYNEEEDDIYENIYEDIGEYWQDTLTSIPCSPAWSMGQRHSAEMPAAYHKVCESHSRYAATYILVREDDFTSVFSNYKIFLYFDNCAGVKGLINLSSRFMAMPGAKVQTQ